MNKLYLSKNLTFLGSLALGAITATGIVTSPVRAAVLGELEWGNGTTNFFEDALIGGAGTGGFVFDDFEVIFSPGDLADSFDTFGIFVPPLELATFTNPQLLDVPAVTGSFSLVGDGTGSIATYQLDNDLTFNISDPDTVGSVAVTFGAGAEFLAAKDFENGDVVGIDLEETTSIGTVVINGGPNAGTYPNGETSVSEILTFGDLEGGVGGEYGAEVQINDVSVPEPGTILGFLAFGGLGLAMKRKKQS